MEEYNLKDVVVTFAGFLYSPTVYINQKSTSAGYVEKNLIFYYRHCHFSKTVEECQGDTNTIGDVFIIVFTIKYPKNCITKYCRQKYLSQVNSNIENVNHTLDLILTFTNNQTINFQAIFCSFGTVDTGKHLQFFLSLCEIFNLLMEVV
jgi:hypothetical protein